jgi:predicted DNA-binding transcriptional regulator YafY
MDRTATRSDPVEAVPRATMAKKRKTILPAAKMVTADRAARLYQLLQLLGRRPRPRDSLLRRLNLNVRGFYRDLETLHKLGIMIEFGRRGYTLLTAPQEALSRLPFPDPGLTFAEALELSRGRTAAHRKLKRLIGEIGQ